MCLAICLMSMTTVLACWWINERQIARIIAATETARTVMAEARAPVSEVIHHIAAAPGVATSSSGTV